MQTLCFKQRADASALTTKNLVPLTQVISLCLRDNWHILLGIMYRILSKIDGHSWQPHYSQTLEKVSNEKSVCMYIWAIIWMARGECAAAVRARVVNGVENRKIGTLIKSILCNIRVQR